MSKKHEVSSREDKVSTSTTHSPEIEAIRMALAIFKFAIPVMLLMMGALVYYFEGVTKEDQDNSELKTHFNQKTDEIKTYIDNENTETRQYIDRRVGEMGIRVDSQLQDVGRRIGQNTEKLGALAVDISAIKAAATAHEKYPHVDSSEGVSRVQQQAESLNHTTVELGREAARLDSRVSVLESQMLREQRVSTQDREELARSRSNNQNQIQPANAN